METIKTVGIKALKDYLIAYISKVKTVTIVLITDHNRVIAEIHQPSIMKNILKNESAREEWIRNGKLISPKSPRPIYKPSPVSLHDGTAKKLIDQDRE